MKPLYNFVGMLIPLEKDSYIHLQIIYAYSRKKSYGTDYRIKFYTNTIHSTDPKTFLIEKGPYNILNSNSDNVLAFHYIKERNVEEIHFLGNANDLIIGNKKLKVNSSGFSRENWKRHYGDNAYKLLIKNKIYTKIIEELIFIKMENI